MNRKSLETQKREMSKAATGSLKCGLGQLGAKPSDFALGSPQSRAAARAQLDRFESSRVRIEVRHSVPNPWQNNAIIHAGEWFELDDGRLMRWVYHPPEKA